MILHFFIFLYAAMGNTFLHLAYGALLNHPIFQLHSTVWFIQPLFHKWAFMLFPIFWNYKNVTVSNFVDIHFYSIAAIPIIQILEVILLSRKVYEYVVLLDIAKIISTEIISISISTSKMLVFSHPYQQNMLVIREVRKKAC